MPTEYRFRDPNSSYRYDFLFDDVFVSYSAFGAQGNIAYLWGTNTTGKLGTNDTSSRTTPVTTFAGGSNWVQIDSNDDQSAGIKSDGTLWTWGLNNRGQLGVNDLTDRLTPVTTFAGGTNWSQVSSGSQYMFAIKTDGTLWSWGLNAVYGFLGDNTTTNRRTPVTTFAGGTNWKKVIGNGSNIIAVKTDGTLWIWGVNTSGQLGNNTTTDSITPVTTFAGGTDWSDVSTGTNIGTGNMCMGIKTDGTLWTWGDNSAGALGTNDTTSRSTPVTTFAGGTNWKSIKAMNAPKAIKTDGTLWSWGRNIERQIGDNTITNRSTPVTTFAGGTDWKKSGNNIFVKKDGTLWTTSLRTTPVILYAGSNWYDISHNGDAGIQSVIYNFAP